MENKISSKIENGILYIVLSGRIDSANSAKVQDEIYALRSQAPGADMILDAGDLEYISSAGLRVVLRLRKDCPALKIINVSSEVYDIFDMTGFTEMLTIEKAYRKISVDGCEVIGRGSNGIVYRIDPDTIIKVYLNPDALSDIQREQELARKALILGIPTAIPYDVVRVGNTYGTVFELLEATSLSTILTKEPERFEEVAHMYVDLLKLIHSTEIEPGYMPDMKLTAQKWAADVKECLPDDKWNKLCALIDAVPDNMHVIHGDYHTKNVKVQNGEVLLIDMDTLCHGDPVFEFASIYNAYVGFYVYNPPKDGLSFIDIPYQTGYDIWQRTLELYFGTTDKAYLSAVEDKAALIGLTRILRRTRRRLMNDSKSAGAVEFYIKRICELLERVDTLKL